MGPDGYVFDCYLGIAVSVVWQPANTIETVGGGTGDWNSGFSLSGSFETSKPPAGQQAFMQFHLVYYGANQPVPTYTLVPVCFADALASCAAPPGGGAGGSTGSQEPATAERIRGLKAALAELKRQRRDMERAIEELKASNDVFCGVAVLYSSSHTLLEMRNPTPPQRHLLDRLLVRAPALAGLIGRRIQRIRPGSPLRRRVINRQLSRVFAAMARSDVEVVQLSYEPNAEVWMRSMTGVGISDCYRGHEGVRNLYSDLDEAFDDWWWTITAVADGGDRLAVRGDFVGYGRTSGVKTDLTDGATAVRFSDRGLVVWQEWFVEQDGWQKALAAVGLTGQDARV